MTKNTYNTFTNVILMLNNKTYALKILNNDKHILKFLIK